MVGSIERINQDIAALDQAVAKLAEELHSTYSSYLTLLGQTVRQQLILASYNVCTQGYPEEFLRLGLSQRQHLQQTLKHLAQQVQEELLAQLHPPVVLDDPEAESLTADLPAPIEQKSGWFKPTKQPVRRSLTPADLIEWQQAMEQAIGEELRTASHAANRLLQQAGVMPHRLPEPVLEAATRADLVEMSGNTPNLLNLLVETAEENSDDKESLEILIESRELRDPREQRDPREPTVMHIVAIHLRLAEIEFADPALTSIRTKIRSLSAQLKTLGRNYQKKQRERAIAEAQAAWRSSWSDEN
jgi:hypothetical protein